MNRRGVAQPRMAGAQLGRDSAHVDSKEACAGSLDAGMQDGGGPGLRQGRRAVTFSEPPA